MSATISDPKLDISKQPETPLQAALDSFNEFTGYELRAPIFPDYVEKAAELAELRGRHDIAQELRAALEATSS